jgi:hypothetical protein
MSPNETADQDSNPDFERHKIVVTGTCLDPPAIGASSIRLHGGGRSRMQRMSENTVVAGNSANGLT